MDRRVSFFVLTVGISAKFDQRLHVFDEMTNCSKMDRLCIFGILASDVNTIYSFKHEYGCDSLIPLGGTVMH
jgi:hypothetical protein